MSLAVRAALLLGVVALASPASAQTRDQNWDRCKDVGNSDLSIGACTTIILSGSETTRNLSVAFYNRGLAYHRKKDYDRAIESFDRSLQLVPDGVDGADAYAERCWVYTDKGDHTTAIRDCDRAIALVPGLASAYATRGLAYRRLGQYERAIRDYDESLRLKPEAGVYQDRGVAYDDLGQYDRAIQDYDQSIRMNPASAIAFNNRSLFP